MDKFKDIRSESPTIKDKRKSMCEINRKSMILPPSKTTPYPFPFFLLWQLRAPNRMEPIPLTSPVALFYYPFH